MHEVGVDILYPIIDILYIYLCNSDIYMINKMSYIMKYKISCIMKYKISYNLVNKISELIFHISYFTEGCKITQHAKI